MQMHVSDDLDSRDSPGSIRPRVVGRRQQLSVVGLFAGVGGIEKGLSKHGHKSTMLCELDPAARTVLKKSISMARN